jgi:diaminohydroxyphosphoribosylaminopyrimidine deaminase / 5-amino-6-(5-phosphoribosylamino)uracil reductase
MVHASYMLRALAAAKQFKGFTEPNPAVGAVLVRAGAVVAVGAHRQAGKPHAEVIALQGETDMSEAVLYVTLEPCCHHGKTPPCTDLIISKGVKQVVFAFYDPNPKVSGNGRAKLEQAGVVCEHLPLPEIDIFYREYAHWVQTKRPWVTVKIAVTADGYIAGKDGAPLAITGEGAHHYTHLRRKHSSALLTSVQTIINDNPAFNSRVDGECIKKPLFVLDRQGRMPGDSRVLETTGPVFRLHDSCLLEDARPVLPSVTNCAVQAADKGLCLATVLRLVAEQGVHHLWVEVGAELLLALFQQNCVNELVVYVSSKTATLKGGVCLPKLLPATGKPAHVYSEQLGDDWMGVWLL